MKILKNVRHNGEITDITVDNGKIVSIGKTDATGIDFGGNKIYPGLIDIHIHGCIGYDTMEGGLAEMSDWLLSQGTTTWYPTTMTMPREDIARATGAKPIFATAQALADFIWRGRLSTRNTRAQ